MKHINSLLLTGAAFLITACSDQKSAVLTGNITNSPSKIALLINGEHQDTINIANDGSFRFDSRYPDATLCTFMVPGVKLYQNVWMENGKQNELIIDAENVNNVSLKGDSEKEVAFISRLMGELSNLRLSTSDSFDAFLKEWENYSNQKIFDSKAIGNDSFTGYIKDFMTQYVQGHKHQYMDILANGNIPYDSDNDFNAYMESIDLNDVANMKDNQTFYYLNWKSRCQTKSHRPDYYIMMQIADKEISNPDVRNEYGFRLMRMYLSSMPISQESEKVYNLALQLIKLENQKQATDFYNNTVRSEGSKIENFDMLTPDGKTVGFQDVCNKKIVYVDVWSTWCGPCCREIPYVAKLVEHYKDNPEIKFVSISIDQNLKDWKNFLKKHASRWEQYVIPNEEDDALLKRFAINGIPRFMVFDEKSQVINLNADRPSSKDIISYLDGLLKEK